MEMVSLYAHKLLILFPLLLVPSSPVSCLSEISSGVDDEVY
jgi:hypothetical protein